MVPELSYKDLNIQEGGTASNTFSQMVQGIFDGDVVQTRKDLLAYCELDTLAMVMLYEELREVVGSTSQRTRLTKCDNLPSK